VVRASEGSPLPSTLDVESAHFDGMDTTGQCTIQPEKRVWTFGVGEEGIREPLSTWTAKRCLLVDEAFPWWWPPVKSVGITVSRIWLTKCSDVGLGTVVQQHCKGTQVEYGNDMSDECRGCLGQCDFIFVGGHVPDGLMDGRVWKNQRLASVVTTSRPRKQPPPEWSVQTVTFDHCQLGGVTNGVFKVYIYGRKGVMKEGIVMETGRTHQDLRWILKNDVPGSESPPPMTKMAATPVAKVVYCGKGVVSSAGLYPVGFPSTQVHTQYRSKQWVTRTLTTMERLLMLDAPEKLVRQCKHKDWQQALLSGSHVPGKVLQRAITRVLQVNDDTGVAKTHQPVLTVSRQRKRQRKDDLPIFECALTSVPSPKKWKEDTCFGSCPKRSSVNPRALSLPRIVEASGEESDTSEPCMTDPNARATKNDDAEVRVDVWNRHLQMGLEASIQFRLSPTTLDVLREFFLRVWRRRLTRSYFRWEATMDAPNKFDYRVAASDCILRACGATWWQWEDGSRPFFWRWPVDYQLIIREGLPPWFEYPVKPCRTAQREPKNIRLKSVIEEKLQVIRSKRYVEQGSIDSLMPFFDVPKGEGDVRMVYNGSANGLNDALWAPWFPLPTVDCLIRALSPGYHMADNDVGEMFHNFILHPDVRKFCGLDMTLYFSKPAAGKGAPRVWERWNRLAMGLRSSPYAAVQAMLIAQEVILGDRLNEEGNVFSWDKMMLNLPGQVDYNPSRSWVTKVHKDGSVAADMFVYVDDVRSSASTALGAWQASQRVSSVLAFLGLQDAARKRRDPGMETGAWTGSIVWTSGDKIIVKTTQEKWDKARRHIVWMVENQKNVEGMDGKTLQSIRGFLVYIARTYPSMVPYLKGIHATIDSWRPGRDKNGWKTTKAGKRKRSQMDVEGNRVDELDTLTMFPELGMTYVHTLGPVKVFPVPRLKYDLECLVQLTSFPHPPDRQVRMNKQAKVMYGFGDASKQGFGTSIELPDKSIMWRFGQWRLDEEQEAQNEGTNMSLIEERSSNYRELRNLVEALEDAYAKGLLDDREIFMFTDNSTAEAAFFKGTSSSELLFNLIIRLRKIEMTGVCIIHMIHVAGTRMIWQGTDGLSRGDWNAGVMAGDTMLSFIPLHLTAVERVPKVEEWIRSWFTIEGGNLYPLRWMATDDWATNLIEKAVYVWVPPPAAADVAAEYMAKAIHKRPTSTHIFLCPRLMTARWQRIVRKTTDVMLCVPVGSCMWDSEQHEPLILAVSFPLSVDRPWKHGGTVRCESARKCVQDMLENDFKRSGSEMCKFIIHTWAVAAV
jgi:hypothetical protein